MAETLPAVAPDLAELGGPAGDGGVAQHQCGSIAKPLLSPRLYAGWPMPPRPTHCWSAGTQRGAATATRVDCGGQFPYRRSAAPEAVHIAFFGLLVAGDAVALSAVLAHWCHCVSRDLRSRSR
jgi:hypothetical protein